MIARAIGESNFENRTWRGGGGRRRIGKRMSPLALAECFAARSMAAFVRSPRRVRVNSIYFRRLVYPQPCRWGQPRPKYRCGNSIPACLLVRLSSRLRFDLAKTHSRQGWRNRSRKPPKTALRSDSNFSFLIRRFTAHRPRKRLHRMAANAPASGIPLKGR